MVKMVTDGERMGTGGEVIGWDGRGWDGRGGDGMGGSLKAEAGLHITMTLVLTAQQYSAHVLIGFEVADTDAVGCRIGGGYVGEAAASSGLKV